MMKRKILMGLALLMVVLLISGCSQPVMGDTGSSDGAADPAAGTSPKLDEAAAKAMELEKQIGKINEIILMDLEGKKVERSFTAEELTAIQSDFNESYIMDTMYIEMIAGMTMTLILEDGREVFITSYGQPEFIVARLGDTSYHLGCEGIGKILLGEEQ